MTTTTKRTTAPAVEKIGASVDAIRALAIEAGEANNRELLLRAIADGLTEAEFVTRLRGTY